MILNNTDPELKALLTRRLYECYGWQGNSTNSHDDYEYRITTQTNWWDSEEFSQQIGVTLRNDINVNNNNETELYCPKVFDAYLCWQKTKAGTVANQLCPDFVEGFNKNLFAHKTCLENGEWYRHPATNNEWSNYTGCIDYEDLEFRQMVNELYVKGYTISLITLVLSLCIFLGFRSLRCTRIRIHVHLFMSLALTCILWIICYKVIIEQPENIIKNHVLCVSLHLISNYMMLANYFWMFCEGLHLHLVLVVVFVKDTIVMRWFMAIGWLAPILFLIPYGVLRAYHPTDAYNWFLKTKQTDFSNSVFVAAPESNENKNKKNKNASESEIVDLNTNLCDEEPSSSCWMEDSTLMWILTLPVCISLIASFFFLINVVRVLVKKLHPCSAQPAPLAIRKAVRATIILVPLFGLQHFLLPYRPDHGTSMERIYQVMSAFLVSLQGLSVSCLFCFANHDVIFAIRNLLSRLIPGLIPPLPPGTNTGQLPTQTPSRDIGV